MILLKFILWLLVVLLGSLIGMLLIFSIPPFEEVLVQMGKIFDYIPGPISFKGLSQVAPAFWAGGIGGAIASKFVKISTKIVKDVDSKNPTE